MSKLQIWFFLSRASSYLADQKWDMLAFVCFLTSNLNVRWENIKDFLTGSRLITTDNWINIMRSCFKLFHH